MIITYLVKFTCPPLGTTIALRRERQSTSAGNDNRPPLGTTFGLRWERRLPSHRADGTPVGRQILGRRWSGSATPVNGTIADGEPRRGDGHHQSPATFHPPHAFSISSCSRLPLRSGLCYLTTFRRPFGASFDWGVSIVQGLRPVGLHRLPVFRRPVRASFDWVFPLYRGFALSRNPCTPHIPLET